LNSEDLVILTTNKSSAHHLPLNRQISIYDLLSYHVDLEEAATPEQIRELAAFTVCPPHKRELEALLIDGVYEEMVVKRGVTMLDLLEKYQACEMPFEQFLELLSAQKPKVFFDRKLQD
jgi:cytochrome P450/NADPH-cytochrome P450 reductase